MSAVESCNDVQSKTMLQMGAVNFCHNFQSKPMLQISALKSISMSNQNHCYKLVP